MNGPNNDWFADGGLLAELTATSRDQLQRATVHATYPAGTNVFTFGRPADSLVFLVSGTARVFRPDGPDGVEVELARLSAGQTVGVAGFVDRHDRTPSVQAVTDVKVVQLPFSALESVLAADPHAGRVYRALSAFMQRALRDGDDARVAAELELSLGAKLLVTVITIQSGTLIATDVMQRAMNAVASSTVVLVGYLLFITAIGVTYTSITRLPRKNLGVTLKDWRPALKEALGATGGAVLLVTLAKWAIVSTIPEYAHVPVFDILDVTAGHGRSPIEQLQVVALSAVAYALAGGFQELYARGMLQGQLYRLTNSRFSNPWPAILISNVLFASIHVAWSTSLMVASFVGGLLWGWLYARRQTLVGVTVSHVVLGLWIGRIVNLFALFKFGPLAVG